MSSSTCLSSNRFSLFQLLSEDHVYESAILTHDTVAMAGKITCEHISNFAACVELVGVAPVIFYRRAHY